MEMRKALLAGVALAFVTAGAAWAQQGSDQGGAPGQAGKLATGASGGAPGATAASGTEGGPAPQKAGGGGTTAGQGVAAQAAKTGTGAAGGAAGAAAAAGTEGGCPTDKTTTSAQQGGGQPNQAKATPSKC